MIKLCENCKLIKECPQFNDIDIECYDDETEFEGKFEFKYTDEIIRVPKDSGFEGNEFHGSKPEREVILYNCWGVPEEDYNLLEEAIRIECGIKDPDYDCVKVFNIN